MSYGSTIFLNKYIRKKDMRQILNHYFEKFSLMIRDDIEILSSTKIPIQPNKNVILEVNFVSGAKNIKDEINKYIESNEQERL